MKRTFSITVSFLFLLLFVVSCGEKKKTFHDLYPSVEMEVSAKDTNEIKAKTVEFLELLKAKNVDAAVKMLYHFTPDSAIVPLPDSLAKQQRFVLNRFPCLSYKIDEINFHTEIDTEVKYTIEFFEKDPGDTRPNTISFFLRPMRRDGIWYLTLWDTDHDHTGGSMFKNY